MYYLLSMLIGAITAVMIAVNGSLSGSYGSYTAMVIAHVVGIIFAFILLVVRHESLRIKEKLPLLLYTGGMLGYIPTIAESAAFGKITTTSIVALSLFGQTLMSIIIDTLGLFNAKKQPIRLSTVICIIFCMCGIGFMLKGSDSRQIFAMSISVLSGIALVISRFVSAGLSEHATPLMSAFISHITGLFVAVIALLIIGRNELSTFTFGLRQPYWMYLGGTLGVMLVVLSCVVVPHIPAFRLALLLFIAQLIVGLIIDLIAHNDYSTQIYIGGAFIAVGLIANMLMSRKQTN